LFEEVMFYILVPVLSGATPDRGARGRGDPSFDFAPFDKFRESEPFDKIYPEPSERV
jgi:hypothetical protein